MRVIHKVNTNLTDYVNLYLPHDAKILSFQEQKGLPTIWYEFEDNYQDTTTWMEERRFWIIGTGNPFNSDPKIEYIATWQFSNGLVWHLYEDKR